MEDSQLSSPEPSFQFRWGKRDLIAFTLFFFATAFFLPNIAILILRMFEPGLRFEDLSGVAQILVQALMDIIWVVFIVFLVRMLHGRPVLPTLRFVRVENLSVVRTAGAGALLALLVLAASIVMRTPTESPLEKLLATTPSLVLFVVFGIALAPLLEEIVFRSFLFTALNDVYGVGMAVPATTVLFAGLHGLQLWGNWAALALIFVVSYVFTIARKRSGSVVPSVIMHTAYNSMIFGIQALAAIFGLAKHH